jgi:peroxiredoxin
LGRCHSKIREGQYESKITSHWSIHVPEEQTPLLVSLPAIVSRPLDTAANIYVMKKPATFLIASILLWFPVAFGLSVAAAEIPDSKTGGVGIILGAEGQTIVVKGILPDSPAAAQKSIRVGDKILAVAQGMEAPVQLQGVKLAQAVPLLRGAIGTTVQLTIVSAGEDDSRARVVSFVRGEFKALAGWGNGVLLTNGMKAPDIEMVRLADGTSERLSDYSGKILVLEFWTTWCGPCQPKMADLQTYFGKNPDWKGKVVLVAASVDDVQDKATKHLKAKGWDQTHNVWVGTNAIKAYHIEAIPTAYIIGRQGKIVAANPVNIPEIVNRQLGEGQDH